MSITYSEIFRSLQGEGVYTGRNTIWLRFFSCNLQCSGFGQKDPTDPTTYELPFKDFDISKVNRLEDLPVWKNGCDSSYSWSAKFKHLNYNNTAEEIADKIMTLLKSEENPLGTFLHDKAGQSTHMCFTGGEPLLTRNQRAVIDILNEFSKHPGGMVPGTEYRLHSNAPKYVTFETNGTQPLKPETERFIAEYCGEIFFSVSPKLFTVSGEKNDKAIRPEIVYQYFRSSKRGQLKFVVGSDQRQWDELDRVIEQFKSIGIKYPVWVMPVGALEEQQSDIAAEVSDKALARGYNVSARVHTYLYGNRLGT